jgi:branched-subunit amino acid ABC-type transport system permease component
MGSAVVGAWLCSRAILQIMKVQVGRALWMLLGVLAVVVGGIASVPITSCGAAGEGGVEDASGSSPPPPIDLLVHDHLETASFGFG